MHTIRQATITDLPAIRYLWQLYAMTVDYPRDQLEDVDVFTRGIAHGLTAEDPEVFVFLAEEGAEPVGILIYEVMHRVIGEPHRYGFCSTLYTIPEARKHGIGMDLIEVSIAHGLSRGLTETESNYMPGDKWNEGQGNTIVAIRQASNARTLHAWLARKREERETAEKANGLDVEAPLAADVKE